MLERYIGIENELISFKKKNQVSFSPYFPKFIKTFDNVHLISEKSIRTKTGHGFYVDGNELEIVTPPISLNKGFATRLTDMLMIARDMVIEKTPKLEHTGYSMHWNLSFNNELESDNFYEGIAIPFQIFGLTPISKGFNLREKDQRYEILGDSLTYEDQINATALLLGASLYALEEAKKTPLQLIEKKFYSGNRKDLFIPDGRYENIQVRIPQANFEGEMQVQQYLELFFNWISPYANSLGTKEEFANLKAFIYGNKDLEFDKFKYFTFLIDENGKKYDIYQALKTTDNEKMPEKILKKDFKKRELALEGKLLGELVKRFDTIDNLRWDFLEYQDNSNYYKIEGIGSIYRHIASLDKNLPNFIVSENHTEKKLKKITHVPNKNKIFYDPEKDKFQDDRKRKNELHFIGENLKNLKFGKIIKFMGISLALTYLVSATSFSIGQHMKINKKYNSIIEQTETGLSQDLELKK